MGIVSILCNRNAEARAYVESQLLRPIGTSTSRKRKAIEVCRNCDEEYDVSVNYKNMCSYHEGMLSLAVPSQYHSAEPNIGEKEVDWYSGTWHDHNERTHGDPESADLIDDPDYEDGYIWSCCQKRIYKDGCVKARHKPLLETAKKLRYEEYDPLD